MASLTFTLSELQSTPPNVHVGVLQNTGILTISASTSASSVLNLCRIPNGATILDWTFYTDQTAFGTNQSLRIGTSNSPSGIASNFSLSGSASGSGLLGSDGSHRPKGLHDKLPVRISLSDDMGNPQTVWVQMRLGAAGNTSASTAILKFTVFYTMDGTRGHTTIR